MSLGNEKAEIVALEEKMDDLTLKSGSHSLPYCNVNGHTKSDNGFRSLGK